ncbi:MAG: hypothetical protein JRI34_03435 [Deltaproteobacteria bacterium]|nr:hypothetical protein [Deltaproteobacteria bacterium]
MKKRYLVIAALTIILTVISCGGIGSKAPIPQAAITEIYALSDVKGVAEFVEIKEVQDRSEGCYMMIYIKSLPQKPTSLEDAINQAESFTMTILKDAVEILNKYDVNQNAAVWAQLPSKEIGITVLGHARYDAKRKTFHDFEPYESK